MKVFYIEAKSEADIMPVLREAFGFLKKDVTIMSTIQHLHKLKEAKEFLAENGIKAEISGQVLGCRVPEIPRTAEQILYIGSGKFHPVGIYMKAKKEVIAANPFTGSVSKITAKDVEAIEKRRKGAVMRFLSSENIGILVSTKPGQANVQGGMKRVEEIRNKHKDKKFYLFAFGTLQQGYLENFPFIDCWLNTACPRIFEDIKEKVVNIEDL